MTPKEKWKLVWRLLRIARREAKKATMDMMLFGTGVVSIDEETGESMHIPLQDIVFVDGKMNV